MGECVGGGGLRVDAAAIDDPQSEVVATRLRVRDAAGTVVLEQEPAGAGATFVSGGSPSYSAELLVTNGVGLTARVRLPPIAFDSAAPTNGALRLCAADGAARRAQPPSEALRLCASGFGARARGSRIISAR